MRFHTHFFYMAAEDPADDVEPDHVGQCRFMDNGERCTEQLIPEEIASQRKFKKEDREKKAALAKEMKDMRDNVKTIDLSPKVDSSPPPHVRPAPDE